MCCILCLKTTAETSTQIAIYSTEGQSLEVEQVIEKHFWLHPNEEKAQTRLICLECWQSLYTFHKFYLKVEEAHKLLQVTATVDYKKSTIGWTENIELDSSATKVETNDIKTENDAEFEENPISTKRRRGRPKRHSSVEPAGITDVPPLTELENVLVENIKDEEFMQLHDVVNVHIDEGNAESVALFASTDFNHKIEDALEIKTRKRGRPRRKKTTQRAKLNKKIKVKSATVKLESVRNVHTKENNDLIQSETQANSETEQPFEPSDVDSEAEYKSTNTKRETRKQPYSQQTLKSKASDEFIAANFKLICCLCQQMLPDFSKLKTHFRTAHKIRGYVLCCGKKLLKRGVLVDHIRTHQDPHYFKCERCEKVLADRRCLELHKKGHEDKRERIYDCDVCSKSFYRYTVYRRHLLLHVPEEEKKIPCPQCEKTFATNYTMTQHLKLVHLNVYVKICDICGKSIRGREALKRHQDEHDGVIRSSIQCELCGITLTTKYGLTRHLKVMHTAENLQPQVCTVCSKVSPNLSAHQRHMQYMHSMERKHACPMCSKAFKRTKALREHMTTHTGEVLYTCPHCPKTFNSNANMHSHRKKMHRKEWEEKRLQRFNRNHPTKTEASQLVAADTSTDCIVNNFLGSNDNEVE